MPGLAVAPPRRALPVMAPVAVALVAATAAWMASVGDLSDYFVHRMPPGQVLYLFSKLAGLTAGTLLTLQILLMLLRGSPAFRARFAWTTRMHMALGLLTLAVIAAHVGLFVAAASLRGDGIALDLLLPVFGHGPYRDGVSYGAIGLLLLVLLVPLGALSRRSPGAGSLVRVHRLAIAALALAVVHALVIGSEKSSIVALALCAAAVAAALTRRWLLARRDLGTT